MIKYVLFDFDGVIADTEISNFEYYRKALEYFDIPLTDEDMMELIGTVGRDYGERLLARAPRPVTWEELARKRAEVGNTYENGELAASAGVKELIKELRRREIRTALVSSTYARLILTALNRMDMAGLFDVILCGDMCPAAKPDPRCYRMAMEYLKARPEECVVVEDSFKGILAGRRAGARVIAYTGGTVKQDVSMADCLCPSFEDTGKVIDMILNGSREAI